MCRLCLLSGVLLLVLAPAGAQESRDVKRLAEKQKDAIARLENHQRTKNGKLLIIINDINA